MKPFSISRVVKAPVALVYKVQSESAHLEKWLSPEGFKTIHADMDFRVGGTSHGELWVKSLFIRACVKLRG